MKICLYSPYFPKHTGGGEKYFLDVAQVLSAYGQVHLAVAGRNLSSKQVNKIYAKYERFLGQSLKKFKLISSPFGTGENFFKKIWWTRQFDLIYFFTDGSLPASLARKNVLHIQTPLKRGPLNLMERLKQLKLDFVNTNSAFTKHIVETNWRLKVNAVHHPMVEVEQFRLRAERAKKQKIILHVGRFFRQQHSKRQDILIKFFRNLKENYPQESKGWQLVLVGAIEDEQYAQEVKQLAKGLPIKLIHELSRQALNDWYARASLYWHATGFGVDEQEHPEKMEHFGISTVEAMASRAVPIVINRGGQPEILGDELTELLWQDKQTCLGKTVELMNNEAKRTALAAKAQQRAQHFGPDKFAANLASMMDELKLLK
jgi:glycosyltransferase involved in cell wall biosynthesis